MSNSDNPHLGLARLRQTGEKIRKLQHQAHELSNALLMAEIELDLALREIQQSGGNENGQTEIDLEAR